MTVLISTTVAVLSGYAFAKMKFKGKDSLYMMFMAFRMVPQTLLLIPNFLMAYRMGLYNTHLGVVLPGIAGVSFMPMILVMNHFRTIPDSIFEAARIDGANTMGVFAKVIMPLSKPIIATVAVFCFIGVWNDYLWPSMILPSANDGSWPLLPIQTALMSIQSIEGITTGEIMASLIITSIPIFIIYVAAQKYIVQGFGTAGLKM
jgi:ABC-type glycerol-3-phosphate transport system permease component